MVLKFLKIILIGVLILVITLSILLMLLSMQPFVPNNYTQTVKTGGELEARYLAMGTSQVEHMEVRRMGQYQCLLSQRTNRKRGKLSGGRVREWHRCIQFQISGAIQAFGFMGFYRHWQRRPKYLFRQFGRYNAGMASQ